MNMNMDNLSKTQVVWLTLLVTIVTSVVTAIVTVALLRQAPPPITQTINRVIEKTIGVPLPGIEEKKTEPEPPPQLTREEAIIKVVKDISPAVVSVIASKDLPVIEEYFVDPFGDSNDLFKGLIPDIKIPQYRQKGTEKRQISSGSGFFVSSEGLLLTNRHVVEDKEADYSIVTNDGKKYQVRALARDPFQDIAILEVNDKENKKNFHYISLGDSANVSIGQTVIAVGNALGEFRNTVSVGIVSGLNRNIVAEGSPSGPESLQDLIQTDAAINPGNSGGPLIDLNGRVIGLNTAVAQGGENIGFALPINIAKRDINDAKEFGKIKYPYLGIRYKVEEKGLRISRGKNGEPAVELNSPASIAGIRENDIIVMSQSQFIAILNTRRVGDKVNLKILRGDATLDLTVTLGERPSGL